MSGDFVWRFLLDCAGLNTLLHSRLCALFLCALREQRLVFAINESAGRTLKIEKPNYSSLENVGRDSNFRSN